MPSPSKTTLARTYLAMQSLAFLTCTVATPLPYNTTSTHILSSNNNNNDISIHCTKALTWLADGLNRNDYNPIIEFIWKNEAVPRDSQQYEFTSPGATSKTTLPKITTPRKYRWETCVVTIAMLDQFRPRELPGSDFRRGMRRRMWRPLSRFGVRRLGLSSTVGILARRDGCQWVSDKTPQPAEVFSSSLSFSPCWRDWVGFGMLDLFSKGKRKAY